MSPATRNATGPISSRFFDLDNCLPTAWSYYLFRSEDSGIDYLSIKFNNNQVSSSSYLVASDFCKYSINHDDDLGVIGCDLNCLTYRFCGNYWNNRRFTWSRFWTFRDSNRGGWFWALSGSRSGFRRWRGFRRRRRGGLRNFHGKAS